MIRQLMHLFPQRSNKTQCGVWGIMTNRLSDVTCPECLEGHKNQREDKTKPDREDNKDDTELVDMGIPGIDRNDYAIGLANNYRTAQ